MTSVMRFQQSTSGRTLQRCHGAVPPAGLRCRQPFVGCTAPGRSDARSTRLQRRAECTATPSSSPYDGMSPAVPPEPLPIALPPPQPLSSYDEDLPSDAEVVPLGPGRQITAHSTAGGGRFEGLKAAVAGASGGVGKAIVERLILEGVPTRALVRDPYASARKLPGSDRGVELRRFDVTQYMGLPEALADQDVLLICVGSRPALDPLGPYTVDYQGTVNLITAAKAAGVKRVVLVTSVGTDAPFFPLNLLWGVLFWKKRAEEALQRSGLEYTIIRPGGLSNEVRAGKTVAGIVMAGPDTFGLPPKASPGSILRRQVADICVEALVEDAAKNRVFEVVAQETAPYRTIPDLFASVAFRT